MPALDHPLTVRAAWHRKFNPEHQRNILFDFLVVLRENAY